MQLSACKVAKQRIVCGGVWGMGGKDKSRPTSGAAVSPRRVLRKSHFQTPRDRHHFSPSPFQLTKFVIGDQPGGLPMSVLRRLLPLLLRLPLALHDVRYCSIVNPSLQV